MAINGVFMVPWLFFNFLAIQKGALAECSFGFSIQLMFFITFLLVDMPKIDQSETFRRFSSKSDDFGPIRELSSLQVTIIDQSESSRHHMKHQKAADECY